MRIHSDVINVVDLFQVVSSTPGVYDTHLSSHGSRKRARAFELKLSGSSNFRQNGNRDKNAATWDEWGVVIGKLFAIDPKAIIGYYPNREYFDILTGYRFEDGEFDLSGQHKLHRWDYDGTGLACVCGAVSRRAQAEVAA